MARLWRGEVASYAAAAGARIAVTSQLQWAVRCQCFLRMRPAEKRGVLQRAEQLRVSVRLLRFGWARHR